MKKMLSILCAAALVSLSTAALAAGPGIPGAGDNTPGSGLYGSVHDLTNKVPGGSTYTFTSDTVQQRICVYCHTPHHAHYVGEDPAVTADYLPLWSHDVSTVTYTPYVSATFNDKGGMTMNPDDPLTGPSRLCMSCHDGITAVDNYYGNTNGHRIANQGTTFESMAVISPNGQTNHPLGFSMMDVIPGQAGATHQDNAAILSLTNASVYQNGLTGTTAPTIFSRLWNGNIMTCSSCHDVHNNLNKVSYNPSVPNFLLLGSQKTSGICLSCHTEGGGDSFLGHAVTSVPTAAFTY
jgi:hypothetical protein